MNKFTTSKGKLSNRGHVLSEIYADQYAKEYGFNNSREFVKALEDGWSGYIATYKGKQLKVWDANMFSAKEKAISIFKAKKKSDVSIMLACLKGEDYTHTPT